MEEEGNGSNEPENDLKDPLVLEYEPLTELNASLPRHYGLMRESVFYTCLDASSRYLALGSTKGLVVVYDLYSWFFRTFKQESKDSVTVVKINPCVQGLAYGCSNGDAVTVLFSNIREAETDVKRYIVHEASKTTVSALEWDDSGERLFVGYTDGKLVQVDFQYEKGTCSASTLLNGGWNICQLSCSHGDLLISSLTCSLMMEVSTGRLKQIGQSQRKAGPYGGCFGLHDIDPNQAFIARPGFRIWCADNKGEVLSTIKLKSAVVSSSGPPIMLLNEDIDFPPLPEDIHFSLLYPWHSRYLVTFNKNYLWVLDPANVRIIGTHCRAHEVLSVCPCNDHIYMLSREKATVRKLSIRTDLQKFIHRAVLPAEDLLPQESPKAVIPSSAVVSQMGMSTSKSYRESVLPTSKSDEGTDSPTTKSDKETKSPATKSAREANKEKDVASSGKLTSSVDVRPLALLEKESQMKRLAEFNVDQDFGSVVKQVKKKKKKPAAQTTTSPQSPHKPPSRSSVPSTPLSPVVKEYPKIEAIVKMDASTLQPTEPPPPEADNTIVEEGDESKEEDIEKPKSKVSPENSQLETHKEVVDFTPSVVAPCDVKSEEKTSRTGTNVRDGDEASSTLKDASTSESGVTSVQTHSQPAVFGDAGIVDTSPAPVTELNTEVTHQNLPEINNRSDHKPSEPLEIVSHSTTAEDIIEETDNPTDVVGEEGVHTLPTGVETIHDDDGHSDDDMIDQVSFSEDRWIPITPPPTRHQVTALCASSDHLWAVDSKGSIWHRTLIALPGEPSPEWTTDPSVTLQDLAVSREGDLLWGISSKGILVKTLVPQKGKMVVKSWQALEMKQKKVAATSVGFGVNGVWVLCEKGQLLYRSNVSGFNPKGKVWNEVAGSSDIVKLSCWGQAIWALTKDHQLLVRTGFSNGPIGTDWESVTAPCPVCYVSVAEEVVWIVGEQGQVFFRRGISRHTPCGCGPWWEVFVKNSDTSAEHYGLQGLLKFKSMFTSEDPCSVATDGKSGVWVLYNTGLILACLSSLSGSHYSQVTNDDLFNISTWKEVALGGVVGKRSVAWLVRDDGVLFACNMQGEVVKMDLQSPVFAVAGSKHASWVATEDALFSREGFDKRHPLGTMWHNVDLTQLKDRQIQSISLGSNCSWAVDDKGEPWFRFDVFAQDKESGFAQVWIPVQREGLPHPLTKIAMGPSPSYVWAIDAKLNIYVRKGSTADYPIGKGWVLVEGAKGKDVCVSAHHVWVLTPEGHILCRDGVQPAKVEGRTWKPIPGQFTRISCSQDGQIWGITADNNVLKRNTSVIKYKFGPTSITQSKDSFTERFIGGTSGDIDPDWEMI